MLIVRKPKCHQILTKKSQLSLNICLMSYLITMDAHKKWEYKNGLRELLQNTWNYGLTKDSHAIIEPWNPTAELNFITNNFKHFLMVDLIMSWHYFQLKRCVNTHDCSTDNLQWQRVTLLKELAGIAITWLPLGCLHQFGSIDIKGASSI